MAHGTPIMSSAPGTVLATDDYFFNGKTIFVDHGNGLITMYYHLDQFDVKNGDTVSKGQQLGLSGMTGRATGPHLHWSVILNGAMVARRCLLRRNNYSSDYNSALAKKKNDGKNNRHTLMYIARHSKPHLINLNRKTNATITHSKDI